MRSSIDETNSPLYEYTLMPTRMRNYFEENKLMKATLDTTFNCFKKYPVLKVPATSMFSVYCFGNKLFDLWEDPYQKNNINDLDIEISMIEKIRKLLLENEAPLEQYTRLILKDKELSKEELVNQREEKKIRDELPISIELSEKEKQQILFVRDFIGKDNIQVVCKQIEELYGKQSVYDVLKNILQYFGGKGSKDVGTNVTWIFVCSR